MDFQRDGDRVTVVLKTSHLTAALIVLAGAVCGVALFLGIRVIGPALERGAAAERAADSVAWRDAPQFEVVTAGRPTSGAPDAPVTIVEFTDYGCPFCRRHATEVLPPLLQQYGANIRYVVRHFPIPALTANATEAAVAAECAHQQARFWDYQALLLGQTAQAGALGLDEESFRQCLNAQATRRIVERDILAAWEHGVTGTPTFFINGRRFQGARPLEEMQLYIELAMRRNGR
jgi:protein-disulfide isomerase